MPVENESVTVVNHHHRKEEIEEQTSTGTAFADENAELDDEDEYYEDILYTQSIIKNHVITAMGLGLVPLPLFDVVSIVAVQMNLVHRLGDAYDVPFKENAVRASILALIGGVLPAGLGMFATSILKLVPGLGSIAGAAGVVILAGATTYAIGQVFDRHLSSGGDFLDLDIASAKKLFSQKLEEGKKVAADLRKKIQ